MAEPIEAERAPILNGFRMHGGSVGADAKARAGPRHGALARVRAPQRAAASGSPGGQPLPQQRTRLRALPVRAAIGRRAELRPTLRKKQKSEGSLAWAPPVRPTGGAAVNGDALPPSLLSPLGPEGTARCVPRHFLRFFRFFRTCTAPRPHCRGPANQSTASQVSGGRRSGRTGMRMACRCCATSVPTGRPRCAHTPPAGAGRMSGRARRRCAGARLPKSGEGGVRAARPAGERAHPARHLGRAVLPPRGEAQPSRARPGSGRRLSGLSRTARTRPARSIRR